MKNDLFTTQCPNCLTEYELNVSLRGRRAICQKCRQTFVLTDVNVESAQLLRPNEASNDKFTRSYDSKPSSSSNAFTPNSQTGAVSSNFANESSRIAPNAKNESNDSSIPNKLNFGEVRSQNGDAESIDKSKKNDEASERFDSFQPFGGEEDRCESTDAPSDASFDDSTSGFSAEFANETFSDPPPGVWRAGEKLLSGACLVLPLAPGKLYAEGGVGVVQRVRRLEWNVDLVVKSPKPGVVLSETGKESFERECQTWIELGLHANIVSCYFVRRIDGIPRLFIEYAPDGTLRDWILDGRLYLGTPKEALARILDVSIQFAWGLEHAHRQGLLHLDVKPSNVMTSGTTIKVTDFGLSKIASTTTADGNVSTDSCEGMTPSYCSPEQYEAFKLYRQNRAAAQTPNGINAPTQTIPITRQSDIWSWAISILAMFHGRSPCKMGGQTAAEVFEIFLQAPPSDKRPAPPASVVELLRQCFRKNPAERPASMQAVADRLVEIYEEEIGEKFPRRQPQNAALTAESFSNRAISLLDLDKTSEALDLLRQAIAVAPFHPQIAFNQTLALWRVGEISDVQAVDRFSALTQNRAQDPTVFYALGLLQLERCNFKAALDSFRRALELAPKRDDVRQAIQRAETLLPNEAQCLERRVLRRPENGKTPSLFIDETGEFALVESDGERFAVLRAKNGKQQSTFTKVASSAGTSESVFPKLLAVADDYHWKLFATDPTSTIIVPASQSSSQLGTGKRELHFHTVDWGTLQPIEISVPNQSEKTSNEKSNDAFSNAAASAPIEKNSKSENNSENGLKNKSDSSENAAQPVPSPENNEARILFVPRVNEIDVVDPDSKAILLKLSLIDRTITAFSVSKDGRWAAIGDDGAKISIWDVEHGRLVRTFSGLAGSVEALWFDPKTRFVLSLVKGATFQYWRVGSICRRSSKTRAPHLLCLINSSEELDERQSRFDELLKQTREADRLDDVAQIVDLYRQTRQINGWESTRPEFERLLDRRACRTKLDDAVQTFHFYGHDGPISTLAAAWNGSFVVSAGKDGAIRLWGRPVANSTNDSETPDARFAPQNLSDASNNWKNLFELKGHVDWIRSIAISPNNRFLVSGSWDQNVFLWDLATGRRLRRLAERIKNVSQVAFAPDGRTIAVASEFGNASLWDGATGELIFRFRVGSGAVRSLRFTRDGLYLATACDNGTVSFWTGRSQIPAREITGFPASILTIDLSCDRSLLVAGSENGKIYLVDLTDSTGKTRRVLSGHLGGVQSVKLLPDSNWIVSTGKDKTTRIWKIGVDADMKRIEGNDGAIALDFAGTTMFVGGESGVLKHWKFRWDYEFPGPERSPNKIARLIGVLAEFYAIGARVSKRNVPPNAYYGQNANAVVQKFSDEFPLDDDVLRRVCAEASFRGLGGVPRETIRKIALDYWNKRLPTYNL